MQAIVQTGYGSLDVFQLREIQKPVIDDDGVLVRVHAASVNALDWHLMRCIPAIIRLTTGLLRPNTPAPVADVAVAGPTRAARQPTMQRARALLWPVMIALLADASCSHPPKIPRDADP